jgi:diguanylate cyclase (GGDEF)-like protein
LVNLPVFVSIFHICLKNCISQSDKIVRLSGDEFLIFLVNQDGVQSVEIVANFILQQLHIPFNIDTYQISIGVSIGILPSTLSYQQPTDILRDADAAMYQAKRAGKGCHIYSLYLRNAAANIAAYPARK